MRRIRLRKGNKRAITLVELIVAMSLTALFAASVVMLMLPIEKIYRHTNDLSRAQVVADTVVDALRKECTDTYISGPGDVWIATDGSGLMTVAAPVELPDGGPVLVIRKTAGYCETIASNYSITDSMLASVQEADEISHDGDVTSRAIYRLFPTPVPTPGVGTNLDTNYVHFGYFECTSGGTDGYVIPTGYYDYTNPFPYTTYGEFNVRLNFQWDTGHTSTTVPSYILCDVNVYRGDTLIYSRDDVVLCFASPVV